jgi:hypothetical protein
MLYARTPSAPRRCTASRKAAPADDRTSTTFPLTSIESSRVLPAPPSISAATIPLSGVEYELMASMFRFVPYRSNGTLSPTIDSSASNGVQAGAVSERDSMR